MRCKLAILAGAVFVGHYGWVSAGDVGMPAWLRARHSFSAPEVSPAHALVRFGSLADITTRSRHVRFTPDSGRSAAHPSQHLAVGL